MKNRNFENRIQYVISILVPLSVIVSLKGFSMVDFVKKEPKKTVPFIQGPT